MTTYPITSIMLYIMTGTWKMIEFISTQIIIALLIRLLINEKKILFNMALFNLRRRFNDGTN